jgi:GTP-binding protein
MTIRSAVFDVSAPNLRSCPPPVRPEIALIGRSNVGKSSLINLLADRRALAKVSVTPGKTQLINFFLINDRWFLVDLPGYGYAKVAQEKRVEFNEAVGDYLEERPNLARVFVLIDSRLPPQAVDLAFIEWLQSCEVPYALVFTKIDKVSTATLKENIARFRQEMPPSPGSEIEVLTCSARTKTGRAALLRSIEHALAGQRPG